jgi:hypothetical protein
MNRIAALALLCLFTAVSGRADDALVGASKDAKSKRKKSTTKVITNADVKKSKGVLIDSKAAEQALPPAPPGEIEQFEAARRDKAARDVKITALQQRIAEGEKELAAIEQSYYEESDFTVRDTAIVRRFNEAKGRLDQARKDLEALRPPATDDAGSGTVIPPVSPAPPPRAGAPTP